MKRVATTSAALLAALALAGCGDKGTLDNSRVEIVKVEGRRFEVRVAETNVENEYRLLVVRATIVIDPDPEAERSRGWNVAKPIMARTCKGRPYQVLEDRLVDNINLYTHFRCGA